MNKFIWMILISVSFTIVIIRVFGGAYIPKQAPATIPPTTGNVRDSTKVIVEQFIVVSNPTIGTGYYLGRTLDSTQVIFEDMACKFGMGDTIIVSKILK